MGWIRDDYSVKQFLIIDKSLGMTHGKAISQACHASMKVFFDRMRYTQTYVMKDEFEKTVFDYYECPMTKDMTEWKEGRFTKVVLKAANQAEMSSLIELAVEHGAPIACVKDDGKTQVEPGSLTAMAIGPFDTTNPDYAGLVEGLSKLKLY
jgi:PTH2 family peptidyl-tRNA hydrolase